MTQFDIQEAVHTFALREGFATAGIAPVPTPEPIADYLEQWIREGHAGEMDYLKRRDEQGRLLRSSMAVALPWARSIILFAAAYDADAPLSLDPAPPSSGWIARYAWSGSRTGSQPGSRTGSQPGSQAGSQRGSQRGSQAGSQTSSQTSSRVDAHVNPGAVDQLRPSDYHKVLLRRLKRVETALHASLEGEFTSRAWVDTGPVIERSYARTAGVGWIGKNTCTLSESLGSFFFLGMIATSLELEEDQRATLPPDRCGSCTRCIDACPTQALPKPYQMDASRCIAYLTIEKRGGIPAELRRGIGRQVFGCDICQDVCPWNKKVRRSGPIAVDPELEPRPELINPDLSMLAALSPEEYARLFHGSPVKRARYEGLRRNVAIAMGNSGCRDFLPQLHRWSHDADPVLAEAAQWALSQFEQG